MGKGKKKKGSGTAPGQGDQPAQTQPPQQPAAAAAQVVAGGDGPRPGLAAARDDPAPVGRGRGRGRGRGEPAVARVGAQAAAPTPPPPTFTEDLFPSLGAAVAPAPVQPIRQVAPVAQPPFQAGGPPPVFQQPRGAQPAFQPRGAQPAFQPRGAQPASQPRGAQPASQPLGTQQFQPRGPIQQQQPFQQRGPAPIQQPAPPRGPAPVQQPTQPRGPAPVQQPAQPRGPAPIQQPAQPRGPAPVQQPAQPRGPAPIQQPAQPRGPAPTQQRTAPASVPGFSAAGASALDMAGLKLAAAKLEVGELKPIPRPDKGGTAGRPIKLRANFFPIRFNKMVDIQHYDIDVPNIISKVKIRQVVSTWANANPTIMGSALTAFDGRKNLYSHQPLNLGAGKHEFSFPLAGDGPNSRPVVLKIQHVATIPVQNLVDFMNGVRRDCPSDAINALDIVMRELPNQRYVPISNYFFTEPAGVSMGMGLELWNGYYQSIRPTAWKCVMLQVDASVRVFHKGQHVLDLLGEYLQLNPDRFTSNIQFQDDREREGFQSYIKGLMVEVTHQADVKRTYKIIGLSKFGANRQTFPLTQHGDAQTVPQAPTTNVTVFDYFKTQYQKTLRYPNLPCLQAQPADKHRYLPMEFCQVKKGQQLRRLNEDLTAQLIRYSAKPAPDREKQINGVMNKVNHNDQYSSAFGMSISKEMVAFDGRVLEAPTIEYKDKKQISVRDGSWNMMNAKFYKAATATKMACISFDDFRRSNGQAIEVFLQSLWNQARQLGMELPKLSGPVEFRRNVSEVYKTIAKLKDLHKDDLKLIIVVLPKMNAKDVYGEIKKVGDTEIGVVTQCVQPKNVEKNSPQTLANICLKINAKLGSTNSIIRTDMFSPIMREPVMIMGADVTHPAPGDDNKPSIAAVTASYDAKACMYAARISIQKHRQEIIQDLANITKELLINFHRRTNHKPRKIIFYRDGVSEGQFREVLAFELREIQKACDILEPGYRPGITFIVVQKRHHTRLFTVNPRDQSGRAGNVPAGTTVDTIIVHPYEFDFYLCSHQGIQGTSKPAHYYVLYDDSNFSSDLLQQFTYQLCHLYVRCNRSVSIPPPAYYAHHCAFRGRYYLDRYEANSRENLRGDSEAGPMLKAMNQGCMVQTSVDQQGMFFA